MLNSLIEFIKKFKSFGEHRVEGNNYNDDDHDHQHHRHHHQKHDDIIKSTKNDDNIEVVDRSIVISQTKTSSSSSTFPSHHHLFVVRNPFLLSIWRRIERFRAIGILFAFISVLFWSLMGLSFKLNHKIHALETLTISSLIVSITYLLVIFTIYGVRKSTDPSAKIEPCHWKMIFGIPGERTSLLLRCLCGTISLACFYCSYRYIPLGDATTIRFTSPVFIAIFAHFLVNEPFGLLQGVNSLITLTGVILIGRPSFLFDSLGVQSINTMTARVVGPSESNVLMRQNDVIQANYNPLISPYTEQHSSMNDIDSSLRSTYYHAPSSEESRIRQVLSNLVLSQTRTNTNITDLVDTFPMGRFSPNISILSELPSANTTTAHVAPCHEFTVKFFGIMLSLVAAITISISMIFMRKLKKTPASLVIFWFSLSNVLLGAIGLWILDEFRMPVGLNCWLLILLTTLCSGLDQFFITMALKLENAGAVAVIQALCVVISFLFSTLILNEPLYWTSALGGTFIFLSVLVLGTAKMLQEMNYSNIKSTIFQINILHSNSRSFNIDKYSKLNQLHCYGISNGSSFLDLDTGIQAKNLPLHPHYFGANLNEPYLIRMAPISTDWYVSLNIDLSTTPINSGPSSTLSTNSNEDCSTDDNSSTITTTSHSSSNSTLNQDTIDTIQCLDTIPIEKTTPNSHFSTNS